MSCRNDLLGSRYKEHINPNGAQAPRLFPLGALLVFRPWLRRSIESRWLCEPIVLKDMPPVRQIHASGKEDVEEMSREVVRHDEGAAGLLCSLVHASGIAFLCHILKNIKLN